jgi:flagellar L-ring protein FlgH
VKFVERALVLVFLGVVLCGCNTLAAMDDPQLSQVGTGLTDTVTTASVDAAFEPQKDGPKSWVGGPADYFRDASAVRKGDLLTVVIDLDDEAKIKNSAVRSRKARSGADVAFNVDMFSVLEDGNAEFEGGSNSSLSGQGLTNRSEELRVTITAVVRDVLPNGFLLIEGSQEMMVNLELRDVRISGIVDPRFIEPDNSVGFEKIAEARMMYGGRGPSVEQQQSGWGMQLWDKVNPF